ncbi:MAG: hypothetical protein M3494_04345 [Actinomycetota bacterium]|jgi:hypothetical protein|nr:hypothetical protein [Rubrobacter sp.]MDQ3507235.1 hypothetical protein [Actinomycetota bacterium]
MSDEISGMIGEAIGRRLMKVAASAHLFEGKLDDAPIDLWLFLEGMSPLRVFGGSDGWRLSADGTPPEPFDMGESGEVVISDVSEKTAFGAVIGRKLEGAWLVESSGGVVGIRFDFGLPAKPLILNRDDELLILDEFPPDPEMDEATETRIRPVAMK